MDGHWASEVYITPANGPTPADPVRNVTRYATYNAGITWSKTGNKLAFISERGGTGSQLYILALQKPSVAGVAVGTDIDWEDVHLRATQISSMDTWEGAISPDGSKVAFRGRQNGDDLWVASTNGKELLRLTSGQSAADADSVVAGRLPAVDLFPRQYGQLRMTSGSGVGTPAVVPFEAKMTIRREEEFAEIFEQCWRALNESFYDVHFHGANWLAVREKYRPLVKHVVLREDFDALISLMLGELNASHLGIMSPDYPTPKQYTADLGLLFDHQYRGPGLRVAEFSSVGRPTNGASSSKWATSSKPSTAWS